MRAGPAASRSTQTSCAIAGEARMLKAISAAKVFFIRTALFSNVAGRNVGGARDPCDPGCFLLQTIITSLLLRAVRFSGHAQLRLSRKKGNAMTVRMIALCGAATLAFVANPAWAGEGGDVAASAEAAEADAGAGEDAIVVTGYTGTKTDTALTELPQPIKVVTADQYEAQGAISISDTVKYAAGVLANPYGRDTRVDGFNVRGIDALQFRDGMRDIFSYYASITSDPYNFSRVEIVRGPASVLFGQGSIGGLVNLVSKTPEFKTGGELSLVYGSYNRKEVLGDVNVALTDHLAIRTVARVRDADTYVDHVPDDRVMFAPSIRWQPTPDTDVVLTGLQQEGTTGSTPPFPPTASTFRPNSDNPRGRLAP